MACGCAEELQQHLLVPFPAARQGKGWLTVSGTGEKQGISFGDKGADN